MISYSNKYKHGEFYLIKTFNKVYDFALNILFIKNIKL